MLREKCIECGRTLRNYKKGDKLIHRACWIKMRDKDDRRFDFLFCKDRQIVSSAESLTSSPSSTPAPPLPSPVELKRS